MIVLIRPPGLGAIAGTQLTRARFVNMALGRERPVFETRFFDSNLRSPHSGD
ncbi:hypothetical protein RXV91_14340 [Lactiplantibacillus sp. DA1]|nr:hypothetical protein [Lactiplantibacillus sp. DA1]